MATKDDDKQLKSEKESSPKTSQTIQVLLKQNWQMVSKYDSYNKHLWMALMTKAVISSFILYHLIE